MYKFGIKYILSRVLQSVLKYTAVLIDYHVEMIWWHNVTRVGVEPVTVTHPSTNLGWRCLTFNIGKSPNRIAKLALRGGRLQVLLSLTRDPLQ